MKRASVIASLAAIAGLAPCAAFGQAGAAPPSVESADLEELRREIRHLRAQMQSVRAAVAEAVELEKMTTGALTRALKVLGDAPSAAAAEASPAGAASARSAPASGGSRSASGRSLPQRRPAPVAEATSTVRGKVEVPDDEPVAFVFVENVRGPAVTTRVTIEQVRKQFVPSWAVVQRGTTVEFPNLDNIFHNVFSLSAGNAFDLGLYSSAKAGKAHRFMEAGGVDIYCNIHPQMAAGVLVVPSRHFVQVKGNGTFELPDVPAGRRKVVAWAPGSRLAGTWVDALEGETVAVNLRLERKSGRHKRKDGRPYSSYE